MKAKSLHIGKLFHMSWSTLPVRKRIAVLELHNQLSSTKDIANEQIGELRFMLLQKLCKRPKLMQQLTDEQIFDCYQAADFIADEYDQFLLPYFWLGLRKYVAPSKGMENVTYFAFTRADAYLVRYYLSQNRYWGLKAMAVIYRSGLLGTKPAPYNELTIEADMHKLRNVPELFLSTFIFSFLSIKATIQRLFPFVFPSSEDEPKEASDIFPVYDQHIVFLAHSPAYATMQQARQVLLYDALKYLNERFKNEKSS